MIAFLFGHSIVKFHLLPSKRKKPYAYPAQHRPYLASDVRSINRSTRTVIGQQCVHVLTCILGVRGRDAFLRNQLL